MILSIPRSDIDALLAVVRASREVLADSELPSTGSMVQLETAIAKLDAKRFVGGDQYAATSDQQRFP